MRPLHLSEDFQDINILSYRMLVHKELMSQNLQMQANSPPRLFLNANGVNRDVRLPPIESGMEYTVINQGVANTITVKDFLGNTLAVLNPGELCMAYASATEWLYIAGSNEVGGGGGGGISNAYSSMTDGSTSSVAVATDTFKFRTSSLLTVAVQNDDVTHGDNALFGMAAATALSVLGNATNASAVPTYIAAASDGQVLRRSGTTVGFGQVDLTNGNAVSGALPIGNGGTGQTTAILAFNALSPLTTKGDIHTHNGANNVRLAVGTDGFFLRANSATATGLEWVSSSSHTHTSADITDFTEAAQDVIGALIVDSGSIDFTYNDALNSFQSVVLPGGVNHNLLLNYNAVEHVSHSAVVLTAGLGISGGGDIQASRTFDLDLNELADIGEALAGNDRFAVVNTSGPNTTRTVNYWDVPTLADIASSSGTNAYLGTSTFTQSALRVGRTYGWPCPNTNTAINPTLNIDGLGAVSILKVGGVTPAIGELVINHRYFLRYNGAALVIVGDDSIGGGSGVSDGDKGDVTISSSGTVYVVDSAANAFAFLGDITPPTITGNQNDYSPTGIGTASTLRLATDASRNITGIVGGTDGRILIIHNVGANPIVIKDDDGATSTAANRFALNADITLAPDQACTLQYDATSQRWRALANPTVVSGALTAGNKVDITVSGDFLTWTINNDIVTFAKMQNITTDRLIGRDTAGTGDPEEISVNGTLEFLGGPSLGRAAISGDVSVPSASNTSVIGNNVVTYAKMQDVTATQRVIGRNTAGAGDPEEVTATQVFDWITSGQGNLLVRGVSSWQSLTPGTSGQVLTSNGPSAVPTYQTPAGGGGSTGKQTIYIPAGSMTTKSISGAESTSRSIGGIAVPVMKFDPTASEGVNFSIAFPKSWNEGVISYQAFWTAASGSGTVTFALKGGGFADNVAISTAGMGTAVSVTDTLLNADRVHVTSESASVTLSNAAVDTVSFFELVRDIADTLTTDAELIGIKFFYTTDASNDA